MIGFIVINYRTADATCDLVHRVRSHNAGLRGVVLDNSEDEREHERLRAELGHLKGLDVHVAPGNVGFAAGVNRAAALLDTEWLLLLNPDLLDVPDAQAMLAVADDGTAVVGAVVADDSGLRTKGSYGGLPTRRTLLSYALPVIAPTGGMPLMAGLPTGGGDATDVGWVSGACLLLRRSDWEAVPLDESLFMYAEDVELCWRQRERGRSVRVAQRVVVRHRAGGSSAGRPPLRWARNLALVCERRVPGARRMIAGGLAWRAVAAVVLGRAGHGRYLLRSSRAAWTSSR